jgi:hypothetical protein
MYVVVVVVVVVVGILAQFYYTQVSAMTPMDKMQPRQLVSTKSSVLCILTLVDIDDFVVPP